ncbi:MAG: hypothetical protein DRO73_06245 [Candidatus Thorarchaeota archaeon]|nr:MAG: hypothetical protein DRO73_06245 [Candidatus Thorarchaeota archaeon]
MAVAAQPDTTKEQLIQRRRGVTPEEEPMTKTILVTGAAGFIGSHLVDHLLAQGHSVVGVDNLRTGREENLRGAMAHEEFTFLQADICDHDLVSRLPKLDIVYHLAAISSVKLSVEDPLAVNETNVTGTVNILRAARELGVQRVVFSSSAAVYGQPEISPITEDAPIQALSPYGASKIAAEQYMHSFRNTYGMETVILRYFNVYGPRQAYSEYSGVVSVFINRALRGDRLIVDGDGLQTRSLIYVDDVVALTVQAATAPGISGEVINVCGAHEMTVLDIANAVLRMVAQTNSTITHGPPRPGDIRKSSGSLDKARELLGVTPQVDFEQGLRRTIEWYRNSM